MKNITLLFVLLIIIVTTSACTKENISLTEAAMTAVELQKIIKSNKIQRVYANELNLPGPLLNEDSGKNYSFSNGFVTISGFPKSYNLRYLSFYIIDDFEFNSSTGGTATTYHCLLLTFPRE